MRRLSPALVLVLAAFSVPVAIELRTVFGFFGIDLPLAAVAVFEVIMLGALFVAYTIGEADAKAQNGASSR
jgi:hypothetical protein